MKIESRPPIIGLPMWMPDKDKLIPIKKKDLIKKPAKVDTYG